MKWLTGVDEAFNDFTSGISLFLPPHVEKSYFDINESSGWIVLQLVDDIIEDDLNVSILNVLAR